MGIDLQQVINSPQSLRLVSSLAQRLPPRLGHRLASDLADQIVRRRDSQIVRAVRANQWVVNGEKLEGDAMDRVVRATLRNTAHSLFDLYHYSHDMEATRQRIVFDSSFQKIAGLHLSNFDLVLQFLCWDGMQGLVLTLPEPKGGRRLEYEIRKRIGMNLLPASVGSFRQALKHLQQGGLVLTGIDRPIENPAVYPRFFGRPAALPIHHIFLASKARVPVVITATYLWQDGKYHILASDPIDMDPYPNLDEALLRNAEKVLAVAEESIRRAPQQWTVPLPVWPQVMNLMPK
jgi:phosphatidylinositol dimannoside acyltransferase